MSTVVFIDGERFDEAEARVSVFDRGFLYGDSVFETIRTYEGRPYALEEHLARLERSARRVLIEVPAGIETIRDEVLTALSTAANDESYVRVMVTRGRGPLGLDPTEARDPLRIVIVGPLVTPPPEAYEDGVAVVTLHTQRSADATRARGAKVANYLVAVLAIGEARAAGAHECLVIDALGRVVEGANSNVFVALDGTIVTPPERDGPLLGITRSRILEVASAFCPVVERSLPAEDLGRATEMFISSSIREVLPVVRVDGRAVGSGRPGPLTREIHRAFRKKVNEDMGLSGRGAN